MNVDHVLLRYFGGKWKIAPWIVQFFPNHRLYVEPFGGAASVLMHKEPSYGEVYNDLYDEVVNLFEVIRDPVTAGQLSRAIEMTPYARKEFLDAYEPCDKPVEKARRFMVRSWMAFGSSATGKASVSGFRNDAGRKYTLPSHDWNRVPNTVLQVCGRLKGVIIEKRDALDVIVKYSAADCLMFVDPPYLRETRAKGEYKHEFSSIEEHTLLLNYLNGSESMVVLAGYEHELYLDMLPGWRMVTKTAYAGGGGSTKPKRTECLWLNSAVVDGLERDCGRQTDIFEFIGG